MRQVSEATKAKRKAEAEQKFAQAKADFFRLTGNREWPKYDDDETPIALGDVGLWDVMEVIQAYQAYVYKGNDMPDGRDERAEAVQALAAYMQWLVTNS